MLRTHSHLMSHGVHSSLSIKGTAFLLFTAAAVALAAANESFNKYGEKLKKCNGNKTPIGSDPVYIDVSNA